MAPKLKRLLPAATFLLLLLATASTGFAQGRPPQPHHPPPPERPDVTPRPPSVRERQLVMDEMSREVGKSEPRKTEALRMAEIVEDYRELQQVNNRMMAALMREAEPDYDLVVKTLSDIRRRAERMRENLALPVPKTEEKVESKSAEDAAAIKRALLTLDRSIMSFVRSPIFKNTDVLNAGAATKAGRDLADVIELSSRALKDAERFRKKAKN